jgi:lipopolysaccharide export system protein LptA
MLAAVATLCLTAPPVQAQGLDLSKGGPIEVTSRDGIEWRQNEQVVVARGDARAVRGDVTVIADTLVAHYRKKANAPATATPASASITPGGDTGDNEIYRLEADGHVKMFNQTDIAVGDHAIYDIDQAVLVLTGKNMSLTTPNDVMTARDTMEYWSQKHMAVGRGLATVTTADGRRLAADVLVGYTAPQDEGVAQAAAKPPQPPSKQGTDPLGAGGKLQRVEAFGHVEVRTAVETITGDRAVYVADSGISRVAGHVHITRGLNQLNGDEALINMQTGISTLVRDPGTRVEGLIVPNDVSNRGAIAPGNAPSGQGKAPAGPGKK